MNRAQAEGSGQSSSGGELPGFLQQSGFRAEGWRALQVNLAV